MDASETGRAPCSRDDDQSGRASAAVIERQVKPRRADDATRIALVAPSQLIDWRRVLTVVKPDTPIRSLPGCCGGGNRRREPRW